MKITGEVAVAGADERVFKLELKKKMGETILPVSAGVRRSTRKYLMERE